MAFLLGKLLLSYLIGSLSGSLVLGRLRRLDIRQHGSGNAGGTNALRVAGWRFALGVVAIDVGKGALVAWLGGWPFADAGVTGMQPGTQAMACAFAAVVGHCWPLWFGFRGGKGAGPLVGALLVIAPLLAALMFVLWLAVIVVSGYVGLATVLAALAFPLLALAFGAALDDPLVWFAAASATLIVFTHRANLARLARAQEPRFERARLWRRRRGSTP